MIRLLPFAALFVLTVATPDAFGLKADRITFTYTEEGGGMGTFTNKRGKVWIEHGPKGEKFTFTEVTRNKDFIELFDKARKVGVRIYRNHYLYRAKNSENKWIMQSKGRWTE